MKPARVVCMALAFLLIRPTAGGSAAVPGKTGEAILRITVSIYDYAGTRQCVLDNAAKYISHIFKRVGIEVRCVTRKSAGSRSLPFQSDPRNPSNYALRIITRPKKAVGVIQMATGGFATSGGSYATVISDSLREVAISAGIAESTVLGIAAAHELGHLFLPAAYHSESGIMQEHLTKEDWNLAVQGGLYFSEQEAGMMRRHLLKRQEQYAALIAK